MKLTILENSINKINSIIGGGLGRKFSVWILIIILILGSFTNIAVQISLTQTLSNELKSNGQLVSNNLAVTSIEPILIDDRITLLRSLQNIKNIQHDIMYIYIVDNKGNILADSFENGFPKDLLSLNNHPDEPQVINTELGYILDFDAPILGGDLGYIHVGISESSIREVVSGASYLILSLTLLVGAIGILLAYLAGNYLINPIKSLIKGTQEIGRGNLGYQIKNYSSDEIHYLSEAFNEMSKNLSVTINDLQKSEERYKNIVDGTSDAVILVDNNDKIISWNSAAQNIFGYKFKEVENKNINMLYSSMEAQPIGLGGKLLAREGKFIKKDNSLFSGLLSKKLLQIGKDSGEVIVIRDISEQKEKEKLEKELLQADGLATLGQLAAGVAHEINNPLANISLYSQMLLKKTNDEDVVNKLKIISDESDRAALISRGLLEFARQSEPNLTPNNINLEISEILTILNYDLKNISVTTDLGPIPQIIFDRGQIRQVFMNIITNSIQSITKDGKLSIKTRVENNYLKIMISDNGSGISKKNLKKIFDPFYTTKPLGEGTGLGLSISYGIIKRHNGYIEVESEVGKGTVFTIKLPV